MAVKQFYHDIDLISVGQLLNARLHNADNAAEAVLDGALTAAEEGFVIYNTDTDTIKTWDGTQFNSVAPAVVGDVIFQGVHTDLTAPGAPATVVSGSQYIMGAAGDILWTGITINPNNTVEIGDVVLFTSPTEAYVIQRNDVIATETVAGNILLATSAEVIAGAVTDEAVTPATLAAWAANFQFAKTFSATVSLPNNTPFNVAHTLALSTKDAFVVNVMDSAGSQISVDIDSVDANNLTLTARPAVANVVVTVVGY